ncbi:MAG TPA: cupredoxin domain-containing protein [Vicinamibacterales bacterium]|jgi:cytochrome c oxidase subunit 2
MRTRQWMALGTFTASVLLLVSIAAKGVDAQDQGQVREFTIVGDQYAFSPAVLQVNRNDVVKITFSARDIPHSLTIDGPYRISKRAGAGQTVTFEFRADQPGQFPFYCNLTQDPKCKEMKGNLTVR